MKQESPEFLRTSLAAAMTLGLKRGWFYRNARLGCINLLLTYDTGCAANCSYCGLARERKGGHVEKSFIRVQWPVYPLSLILERMQERQDHLGRVCLSMVVHKRAVQDTLALTETFHNAVDLPISLLISPTVVSQSDLTAFRDAGADHIGIAVDCATPD